SGEAEVAAGDGRGRRAGATTRRGALADLGVGGGVGLGELAVPRGVEGIDAAGGRLVLEVAAARRTVGAGDAHGADRALEAALSGAGVDVMAEPEGVGEEAGDARRAGRLERGQGVAVEHDLEGDGAL